MDAELGQKTAAPWDPTICFAICTDNTASDVFERVLDLERRNALRLLHPYGPRVAVRKGSAGSRAPSAGVSGWPPVKRRSIDIVGRETYSAASSICAGCPASFVTQSVNSVPSANGRRQRTRHWRARPCRTHSTNSSGIARASTPVILTPRSEKSLTEQGQLDLRLTS